MNKRFLVLISMSSENAQVGKMVLAGLKRDIDPSAGPQWIDSKGVGIFVSTPLTARDVWKAAFPEDRTQPNQREGVKDVLVLELGRDCLGWPESKAMAWLGSHPAPTR